MKTLFKQDVPVGTWKTAELAVTKDGKECIDVAVNGHPLLSISMLTGRVFVFVDLLQTHPYTVVTVSDQGAYIPSMHGAQCVQP